MSKYLAMGEAHHCAPSKSEQKTSHRPAALSPVRKLARTVLRLLAAPLSVFVLKPISVDVHRHQPPVGKVRVCTYE